METTFLPGLYAPTWYNNKSLVWREKLTSLNRQAIRVGAARLRQLRVKDSQFIFFYKFIKYKIII